MSAPAPTDHPLADLTVRFPHDPVTGRVGLTLFPTALAGGIVAKPPPAAPIDPLVQLKLVGDPYPSGFAHGHTLRNSATTGRFRFDGQSVEHAGDRTTVLTILRDAERRLCLEHRLSWHEGDAAAETATAFRNESDRPVTLEMLSSFTLGGITPFAPGDAVGRLRVHRFRSCWSAEGRLETRTAESLHLERSWSGHAALSERFGQVGTMPVRRWFPFVAVEDTEAGVVWGAQLAWAGSWQMEVYRQSDALCLSGGLADREFGHWMKTVAPGETLLAPPATVSCVRGTLEDLCDRLTARQQRAADAGPAVERDLPIVFNEYCTTWGDPEHGKVVAIAERLRGSDVRFLVIDAGWYKQPGIDWSRGHGDWEPSPTLFPHGLEATAAAIRERGLIPGLWFEMETVGIASKAFGLTDHLLHRDGLPVTVGDRRFWNLNDPWVVDYLTERVIGQLERGGFGYLKVDYNDPLGPGCDHPDGPGEGLREQVLGSYRFFEAIRARLPELVIENCASGGHRLEPSMLGRTAMSSFSDAHELVEIPVIAANLQCLLLPRQSQIWAVLHRTDSDARLVYSLAATFLGRMGLSGEITQLTGAQWALVQEAMRLYRRAVPVIKHGRSRHFGACGESWRHPTGWQAVVRAGADGQQALVVAHAFGQAPERVEIPLPTGDGWRVGGQFPGGSVEVSGGGLCWQPPQDFSACVVLLEKAAG